MHKDIVNSYTPKTILITLILILCLLSLCAGTTSAFAVDENYLEALEAEAADSAKLNSKNSGNKDGANKAPSVLNKKEFQEFESELQNSRPTTYRFYKKLQPEDKTAVFYIYKKDHTFTRASKIVLDLYFAQNN